MTDEPIDTKGRKIGGRRSPDKGKFPARVETGLCPGLEDGLRAVADKLTETAEGVTAMAGPDGLVGSAGVVAFLNDIEAMARDALDQWAPLDD